jgi:hypothetical protein
MSEGEPGLVGIALLNPPYAHPPCPRRRLGSRADFMRSQPREAPASAGDAEGGTPPPRAGEVPSLARRRGLVLRVRISPSVSRLRRLPPPPHAGEEKGCGVHFRFLQHPKPDWRSPSGDLGAAQGAGRGGRRGAPPGNEQGYGMERYRPPRRTGDSAGHPHGGPWSRVFVTGATQTGLPCFSHGKSIRGGLLPGCRTRRVPYLLSQAHPGLTCLGPGGTVYLPQGPSCPCPPDQNGT